MTKQLTSMTIDERIQAHRDHIQSLEDEAQSIYDTFAENNEQPHGSEGERLTAILGENHDGLAKECEMRQAIEALKTAENIKAGMIARHEALKNTTPEEAPEAKQLKEISNIGRRQFAMGASRSVVVPVDARLSAVNLHNQREAKCWGDTRQEREQNAYAAGQWFLAHIYTKHPDAAYSPVVAKAVDWCRDHGILSQQDTTTPTKGPELLPKPLERTIIEIRQMYGIMRQRARIYPMSSKTLDIPKFAGGLSVVKASENTAMSLTEKTWTQVNLVAKKAGGFAQWSTEVGEDAIISLAADLARDFGIAFAYREDYTGFMGDGVDDADNMGITGVVNTLHADATHTLGAGSTAVTDITLADFELLLGYIANVAVDPYWFMHKSTYYAAAHPIKTAAGGNTIGTLTDGDPLPAGADFRFLGYPGHWVNVLPDSSAAAATKGVVLFGDLNRGVAMGERRGVTIKTSEHIKIIEDAMVMTGTSRFDIQTHEDGQSNDSRVIAQIELAAT